jgi:hypothetical protein
MDENKNDAKEVLNDTHNSKLEDFSVQGTVFFRGLPCLPENMEVPPCSGPYPNYKIIVYSEDNHVINSTFTNNKGEFRLFLPNGKYNIFTQAGPSQSMQKPNNFTICETKTESLNLIIDTGIR